MFFIINSRLVTDTFIDNNLLLCVFLIVFSFLFASTGHGNASNNHRDRNNNYNDTDNNSNKNDDNNYY